METLQILAIGGWCAFVYYTVWRALQNKLSLYYHALLIKALMETVAEMPHRLLLGVIIFILSPLFALLTYLLTAIGIIALLFLLLMTKIVPK